MMTQEGPYDQVLFSVYHRNLAKFVCGTSPLQPPSVVDQQAALRRVLKSGLAGLPEDDVETLDLDHPGIPTEFITNLVFDDPRAVDFRSYMRTWYALNIIIQSTHSSLTSSKVQKGPVVSYP